MTEKERLALKEDGFFTVRGSDRLSVRFSSGGGSFSADQMIEMGQLAREFGNGKVVISSRLSAEIVGIRKEDIGEIKKRADQAGLERGLSGPRIRTVTSCMGTALKAILSRSMMRTNAAAVRSVRSSGTARQMRFHLLTGRSMSCRTNAKPAGSAGTSARSMFFMRTRGQSIRFIWAGHGAETAGLLTDIPALLKERKFSLCLTGHSRGTNGMLRGMSDLA